MVDVRRVQLPGVGILHTFVTEDGGKVGVVTHRSGQSDLISFADETAEGADAVKVSLRLDEDEARTLAELLGGTQITQSRSSLSQIPGLAIDWFPVDYDDYIAGKPLGDLAEHGAVGCTVVAVVRGDATNPAPSDEFKVFPGDTLVLAGAPEKVAKAFQFYRTGDVKPKAASAAAPPGE
ncbi:MAG: TrkA C-terminal domain-containing protein [Microbacteriaceae bacterium]